MPVPRTITLSSAHRRHVGAAGGARAHHRGHLRDAVGGHPRLVVEDAAEVVPVGEHLGLQGQERAAGVDQVDAGQPVLRGDLLGAQVLLDGHRVVGAALHGGVVRDHHAWPAVHRADAGDDARPPAPRRRTCRGRPAATARGRRCRGRSGRSIRSRASSLPRDRCRSIAASPPPARTRSIARPRSPTSSRMRSAFWRKASEDGSTCETSRGIWAQTTALRGQALTGGLPSRAGARASGIRTANVVPTPSALSTSMLPPCPLTSSWAIARPSPVPPDSRFRASSAR